MGDTASSASDISRKVKDLQSSGEMIGKSTEEEEKEYDPFKVVDQCVSDRIGIQTILEYG